jgi:hypothetical protein
LKPYPGHISTIKCSGDFSAPSVEHCASAQRDNYIFQVSQLLDATDADTGGRCVVTSGDLIRFAKVPADADTATHMRVVTSEAGSCGAGTIIEISLGDLQQMLNDISERLERNMQLVYNQIASP